MSGVSGRQGKAILVPKPHRITLKSAVRKVQNFSLSVLPLSLLLFSFIAEGSTQGLTHAGQALYP